MPEKGLSCGKAMPSRWWRLSSQRHGGRRRWTRARACLTASSSSGWFRGHSTSNTHQNSSISASSSMALLRAAVAMATSVRGTGPPCPVSTRRSTAATSRTDGCRLRASRYSGSVFSPSQKTTSVFRGFRVATFRLSGRAPAFWLLLLTVLRRWPQGRARAAAWTGQARERHRIAPGGRLAPGSRIVGPCSRLTPPARSAWSPHCPLSPSATLHPGSGG
jgi:hypothetical protein